MTDSLQSIRADLEVITIYEISKVLTSSLNIDATVWEALNILRSHLEMHGARVSMVRENASPHHLAAVEEAEDSAERELHLKVVDEVARHGSSLAIGALAKDPLFGAVGLPLRLNNVALLAVPIKSEGKVIGVLAVYRDRGQANRIQFDRDLRILSLVGNLIGQGWRLQQHVATEWRQLIHDKQRLQKQLQPEYDIENVIGRSRSMKDVFADVHQAARGSATILLRGESGTGKEAIANAVHYLSSRAKGPFIKVNCAALPETLLESELFGHEKGAFTGAVAERRGRFEQAKGGTLFLDEIGDTSPAFQAKLLRVLQEREFERVGGNRTIKVDVRLVCATNVNLEEKVKKGEFRADLYFRINVVSITLPPLRERKEDIPLLADFFLDRFNRENGRRFSFTPDALHLLTSCHWPGNVRELENCIQRTATMARGDKLHESDLRCQSGQCLSSVLYEPPSVTIPIRAQPAQRAHASAAADHPPPSAPLTADDFEVLPERDRLIQALEKCGWVQAKAARLLGMTPRQIGYALRKHRIQIKKL